MHIELLVEDSSGALLVQTLLPAIIGPQGAQHSWRVHAPTKASVACPKG